MRGVAPKESNPIWFFEYINICICKEFGWSEKQLQETSKDFRDSCWLYIIEKANQEYIQRQEQQIESGRDKIFNDLKNS